MEKIGLFYGSDTGYTENVAMEMVEMIGEEKVDCYDIARTSKEMFDPYHFIIIGLSTWHDGQLQNDWDNFYKEFKTISFEGKTVAFFGLGDQACYGEYYIDGIGTLGEVVSKNGGEIVGNWPTEGYDFEFSKAVIRKGWFLGLALDEDNQSELTIERVQVWLKQVLAEFESRKALRKAGSWEHEALSCNQ